MTILRTYRLSTQQCLPDLRGSSTGQCLVPRVDRFVFWLLLSAFWLLTPDRAIALPPPDDLPEEILRTEIITEARSPIDGQPLTAAEYAQLQAQRSELWSETFYSSAELACPKEDFLPCPSNNLAQTEPEGAFAQTNHIINKLPIRRVLRGMFPF